MTFRSLLLLPALVLLVACDNPVANDGDHRRDVAGVELYDQAQPTVRVARTVGQGAAIQWEGELPQIRTGQTRTYEVRWVNTAGQALSLGNQYTPRIRFASDPRDTGNLMRENDHARLTSADGRVSISGRAAGQTSVVVVLWHGSHDDWASPPLPLRVTTP